MLRFFNYFSYWILVWFIISILLQEKITPPFYSFILALFAHICILLYTYFVSRYTFDQYRSLVLFHLLVIAFMKLIPIAYIYLFSKNISFSNELPIFISLFVLYILWMFLQSDVVYNLKYFYKNGMTFSTPLMSLFYDQKTNT